jgi:hypothetical protein
MRSSLVFAIGFAFLVSYLVAVNRGFDPPLLAFWLSILLLCVVPIYQLSKSDVVAGSWEKIILIELVMMTLAFRLIWVLPFSSSLRDIDPHYDYGAAKLIMDYGWSRSLELPLLGKTRAHLEWPLLHILAVQVSNITGIDLFQLVSYLPLIYGPFSLPLFYLFAKTTYSDTRMGLLASYGMSALYEYVVWDSKFVRESLATGIFWLVLFASLKAVKSRKPGFGVFAIVGAVSLVFCHNLTTVMLVLFGASALVVGWSSRSRLLRYFFPGLETQKERRTNPALLFVVLIVVTMVAQWAYAGYWALDWIIGIVDELQWSGFGGTYAFGVMSPRIAISLYGNAAFLLIVGCILLFHVRRQTCTNLISDLESGIWGFLVVGVCLLVARVQVLSEYLEVTRLQKFGWPFILIVTAHVLSRNKRRMYLVLFTLFVILQIFTIPPHYYTRSISPDYTSGRFRGYYLAEEYAAVDWFNSSDKVVGDLVVFELLGGLKQVHVVDARTFLSDDQLHLPPGYLFFYRMEDSQNLLTVMPIEVTKVVTIRPETLDAVANRYYDNTQVIVFGSF